MAKPTATRIDLDGIYRKVVRVILAAGFRKMINLG